MRDFAKVCGRFWNGETGRKLRAAGRDAQTLALYFITCPSSNMLGLYNVPLPTLCHEIGITKEGASKALRRVSEACFAFYDEASEHVWVPEMARWQIGAILDVKDKRVTGIKRKLETLRKSPFFNEFLNKYREPFHLQDVSLEPSPFDAPSMPHRSQETEKETEKENSGARTKRPRNPDPDPRIKTLLTAFVEKYKARTATPYVVVSGKDPALLKRLLSAGHDASAIQAAMDRYLNDDFYRKTGFDVGGFVKAFNRLNSAGAKKPHNFENGMFPDQ